MSWEPYHPRFSLCEGIDGQAHVSAALLGTHIRRAETLCGQMGVTAWLLGIDPPYEIPPCMKCLRLAVWKIQGVLLW